MNANKVAELTGVSVRTLHHYDKIALLCPRRNSENDYREYSEEDIDKLQQILFFKECGFPLSKIKKLLDSPNFDRNNAFALQKKYLLHEKARILSMLDTIEKSIRNIKGETIMSQKEKFHGFDFTKNPYEEEARRLWGDKAVDESNSRIASLSQNQQDKISKSMNSLFLELAEIRCEDPSSELAQNAMANMYRFFNANFGHQYTYEAFAGLGQMYITDERFTKNIDKYGQGLSNFLAEAMQIFSESHE